MFRNNTAEDYGGALLALGVVGVLESTFEGNRAVAGGAILANDEMYSYGSTFDRNVAQNGGAIIALKLNGTGVSTIEVQNSTFVGNFVEDFSASGSGLTGSAIIAQSGSVRQSTFLNNEDSAAAGPSSATIVVYSDPLELRGNIFAGSRVVAHLASVNGGTADDAGANLFTTAQADETVLSLVKPTTQFDLTTLALFDGATLADNGGPTQTVALHGASPALSVVSAGADTMTVDQRGVSRPALSDAGAFEFDDPIVPAGTGDAELANTGTESAAWLVGFAALLMAGGGAAFGFARREANRITRGLV